MKKFALLLAVILALTPVLAACNSKKDDVSEIAFTDLYVTDYEEEPSAILSKDSAIDDLGNCTYQYQAGDLLLFTDYGAEKGETKLAVYNMKTKSIVYSLEKEKDDADTTTTASITSYNGVAFITETRSTKSSVGSIEKKYKLLKDDGDQFLSKEKTPIVVSELANELIAIEGKVYSTKNDTLTELFDLDMKEIPECDVLTDKYNYSLGSYDDFDGMSYWSGAYVYDQQYNLVAYVPGDANAYENNFCVLNDGNVLCCSLYLLLDDEKDYDFTINLGEEGPKKYNISYSIFNPETKETTSVSADFLLADMLTNALVDEDFNKTYKNGVLTNLACIIPIENKTINYSLSSMKYVNLDNELNILNTLEEVIPNQGPNLPYLVADNRFEVSNAAGQTFLVDQNGKVLKEISGNESYAYANALSDMYVNSLGDVYDINFKKVFNLKADGYTSVENNLYRSADGDYYMLTASGYVSLNLSDDTVSSYSSYGDNIYFYTTETSATGVSKNYAILVNEEGQTVLKIKTGSETTSTSYKTTSIEEIHSLDGGILVTVVTENMPWDGSEWTQTYKTYLCVEK